LKLLFSLNLHYPESYFSTPLSKFLSINSQSSMSLETASSSAAVNDGAIKIGCRKSILSLIQANGIREQLLSSPSLGPNPPTITVTTRLVQGDADKTSPFLQMGSKPGASDAAKSLWTTELEDSLRKRELDVLIHCLKDMPTVLPEECVLGPIPEREDPCDSLVVKPGLGYKSLAELPDGAIVGTSSIRRKALLMNAHPKLVVKECRGNL
jgi:hydroxymethylbilane synthase